MFKILFDDNFYVNFIKNREYMEEIKDLFINNSTINFVFFHPFNRNSSTEHKAFAKVAFEKELLRIRRAEKFDLNNVTPIKNNIFDKLNFSEIFIGEIYYIKSKQIDVELIIPLIENVHSIDRKTDMNYIYYINRYDKELNSNINKWIQSNIINVPLPTKNNIFPAKSICNGYNDLRSDILKSSNANTKLSNFELIGFEVATRNHYIYDSQLTAINKQKAKHDRNGYPPKRQVFKNINRDVYLSVDFENGGFEVYDKNARHQGQYKFNGEFEKEPDQNSHPLFLK